MEWLSEAAQVVNAFAVVVLVGVTAFYAWKTKQILDESKKMREAAERQASAANAQAKAAFDTLAHLREQVEDLAGLGRSIVRTTIDSLVSSIQDWKRRDAKGNFASAYTFPSPKDLVPANPQSVIEHARRISEDCVTSLANAFNELRTARDEIEQLKRGSEDRLQHLVSLDPTRFDPDTLLTNAFTKLQEARKFVS